MLHLEAMLGYGCNFSNLFNFNYPLLKILYLYITFLFNFVQPFAPSQSVSNVNALAGWTLNGTPSTSSQIPQGIIQFISNGVRCLRFFN